MIVLGIETSCDETGIGIVENGRKILSNAVVSSLDMHSKYGGVIPEIASRMQLESIPGVYREALEISGVKQKEIGIIAVTSGPGLPGSLIVGVSFAKALGLALKKPVLGIDHVQSHIYANLLCHSGIKMPCVSLVVSGGHTSLFHIKGPRDIHVLGQTRDDACGEAFDKVAKIMGLGYPGGPLIEKMARKGDNRRIKFSCSGTKGELDFSFSGIKTAVMYYLRDNKRSNTKSGKADIAASFQESVVNVLINKSLLACKQKRAKHLLVGGGVAANRYLREKMTASLKNKGISCFFPNTGLCMDNGAMVAGLGYHLWKSGYRFLLYNS